ncbi:DUF3156 family protein [Pseudomonas oryzihabitans]|uniref:DUF3156 family protein n=1 Tax=Pseudomonas oryzihabitans TaxID=47885 RepID=A0A178LBG0_9PSED|nr:DUF3156 family protein [Pseudomonas oryzihabitans]OAN27162.1 hypothetical protein A4V15_21980 [Pseudomonas oryzihabitans]
MWSFWKQPAGYRPGATLARLVRDLPGLQVTALAIDHLQVGQEGQGWTFEIRERPQALFLMHLVTCRFQWQRPTCAGTPVRIRLRHSGWWRRTGLAFRILAGRDPALERWCADLVRDPALIEALQVLDFRELELERRQGQWRLVLEPYAASEVVSRFPAYRRYLRLPPDQAQAALQVLARLQAWIAPEVAPH